jgi:hypothetical protein
MTHLPDINPQKKAMDQCPLLHSSMTPILWPQFYERPATAIWHSP